MGIITCLWSGTKFKEPEGAREEHGQGRKGHLLAEGESPSEAAVWKEGSGLRGGSPQWAVPGSAAVRQTWGSGPGTPAFKRCV